VRYCNSSIKEHLLLGITRNYEIFHHKIDQLVDRLVNESVEYKKRILITLKVKILNMYVSSYT